MKAIYFYSALSGIAVGLLSTFPFALGPWASLIFWALVGMAIGLFVQGKRIIIWSGIAYGFFLSVAFLFSRFGGTVDKLFSYSLFVAILSLGGMIAGVASVFIGSWLRKLQAKD